MKKDTKTQLLDAAQRLVQTRGHNGFSFRHLSKEVGIRTASVHYYFPTKTDLAVALVRRYRKGLDDAMADIAVRKDSLAERLDSTIGLYTDTLRHESRICLCAALAGEYLSLPRPVRIELQGLIEDSEKWIARLLTEGRATRGDRQGHRSLLPGALVVCGLAGSLARLPCSGIGNSARRRGSAQGTNTKQEMIVRF